MARTSARPGSFNEITPSAEATTPSINKEESLSNRLDNIERELNYFTAKMGALNIRIDEMTKRLDTLDIGMTNISRIVSRLWPHTHSN